MSSEKIRVLLADDHAVVRGGTKLIIENEADMVVIGEARDGEELLRLALSVPFDVAIVDINMPKLNGIRAAQQIKQQNPTARVLIMTGYNNESYVQICKENSIDGFLLKERSPLEMVTTIRMLAMGHQVFPKQDKSRNPNLPRLTERERHIIRLVSEGQSNKEIALGLSITERTVEYHLGNLYGKLDVSTRAEAVKKTIDMGLLVDL